MTKKRKNPTDSTLRNVQAANKKIAALQADLKRFKASYLKDLEAVVDTLEGLRRDIKLLTARAGR